MMKRWMLWGLLAVSLLVLPRSVQRADAQGILLLAAAPPNPCVSTGVLDFSNTCNNIYFLTGLQ
jgi:hypothetical protein